MDSPGLLDEAFEGAKGVTARIAPDIFGALWQKLMLIVSMSGIGAVTRAPIGNWRSIPATRTLYSELAAEVYSVAKSRGVAVPEEHLQTVLDWPERLESAATMSLQRDIESGQPSELKEQLGVVVRVADELGVHVPVARYIYSSLLPSERQARREHGHKPA